jgi:hypothetical protein
MWRALVFCVSFALCAAISPAVDGQTLSRMRNEVRSGGDGSSSSSNDDEKEKKKKKKKKSSSSSHHHHHDDDDDEGPFDELGAAILGPPLLMAGIVATVPFWGSGAAIGDSHELTGYFPEHPYEDHEFPGYMSIEPNIPEYHWFYGGHVQAEYGDSFDSLSGIGGRLVLDSSMRLGFDTELQYRREDLGFQLHDDLWTGDANITYRIAQHPQFIMRTGLGVNWLSDQFGTDYGINFTYGAEWFIYDPLVVTAGIDWGRVGQSEIFHLRTEVGMTIEQFEPFVGFDHYSIGGVGIQEVVVGLRIWF